MVVQPASRPVFYFTIMHNQTNLLRPVPAAYHEEDTFPVELTAREIEFINMIRRSERICFLRGVKDGFATVNSFIHRTLTEPKTYFREDLGD